MASRLSRIYVGLFAVLCVALAFITRTSYLNMGFFEDDYSFLARGTLTLTNVVHAFDPVAIQWFYRPIFLLWMFVFKALAPNNAVALHAGNLVLFGLTIFLAGMLVYRLTRSLAAAAATSVLFLYGKNMEEAVWWISCGSTLLASVFSLLTLHLWLSWHEKGTFRLVPLALLTMTIALFSKEDAATLPIILILFDLYLTRRQRTDRSRATYAALWGTILLIMAAYGILDIIAYRSANIANNYGITNLWHGIDLGKLHLSARMGATSLLHDQFSNPINIRVNYCLAFPLMIGFVLFRARRLPLVVYWTMIAILGCLPSPLASGQHALSPRFFYVPNLYGAILAGIIFYYLFTSKRPLVLLTGTALAFASLSVHVIINYGDPAMMWACLAFIPVAAFVTWRFLPETKYVCIFAAILSLTSLMLKMNSLDDALVFAAGAIGAVFGYVIGREILLGVLLGVLCAAGGPISLLLIIAAGVVLANKTRTAADASASNPGGDQVDRVPSS